MAARNKLTNNSEEADISSLLSSDSIFEIPYFQRPYKWKAPRLRQFESDILSIVDDDTLTHFLGAVIIHGRRSSPSDPTLYEVIDGQQRITTIYLYLSAGILILAENGKIDEAASMFQKYLAIGRTVKTQSNFKLHSCKEDRKQLNKVIEDLTNNANLAVAVGSFLPKKLTDTGSSSGTLIKNYEGAKSFFRNQVKTFGIDQVYTILNAMLERVSVVQIDVLDPTNGPKIFDSLNSQQEPMTVGDLIRNEIFSRVSSLSPDEIDYIDSHDWQPFYQKFKRADGSSLFESYFFPYGLIRNPNLNKSEIYGYLRKEWEKLSEPSHIIEALTVYQCAFLDLTNGTNLQGLPPSAAKAVRQFHDFGFPASALPFLMQLTYSMAAATLDVNVGTEALNIIEAFLVRRAICGIEPTGLHAVFRRLWVDVKDDPSVEKIRAKIQEKSTVIWPTDEAVRRCVMERSLYGSSIIPYLIRQFDESLGGDVPLNVPWIEHVFPQTPVDEWYEKFPREQAKEFLNLWANLIPLSSKMNIDLKNDVYAKKQKRYAADAMFKSARQFAGDYSDWTPTELKSRSQLLADWTITRWPG